MNSINEKTETSMDQKPGTLAQDKYADHMTNSLGSRSPDREKPSHRFPGCDAVYDVANQILG